MLKDFGDDMHCQFLEIMRSLLDTYSPAVQVRLLIPFVKGCLINFLVIGKLGLMMLYIHLLQAVTLILFCSCTKLLSPLGQGGRVVVVGQGCH